MMLQLGSALAFVGLVTVGGISAASRQQQGVALSPRTLSSETLPSNALPANALPANALPSKILVSEVSPPATCETGWQNPVDAKLVDPFRQPEDRYSSGNRGLEFGTEGDEAVKAVAVGDVVFAGPVGRHHFVVVRHASGIKSTYAYLSDVHVRSGEAVDVGQEIGRADVGFHLTARIDGQYIDPQLLLDACGRPVKLVVVPESVDGEPVGEVRLAR